MKKNHKRIWFSILSVFLVFFIVILLFIFIPRKLPKTDLGNIREIEVHDGNSGNTVIVTNKEDIAYIVEELGNTNYQIEKPALGFGTSFQLSIKNKNGEIVETFVVQSESQIKKGLFFYQTATPMALEELFGYFYDLCDSHWRD